MVLTRQLSSHCPGTGQLGLCCSRANDGPALDEIRRNQDAIFTIRRDLEARVGDGEPLYFPWFNYSGTLRTALPLSREVPKVALDLFPRLQEALEELEAEIEDSDDALGDHRRWGRSRMCGHPKTRSETDSPSDGRMADGQQMEPARFDVEVGTRSSPGWQPSRLR